MNRMVTILLSVGLCVLSVMLALIGVNNQDLTNQLFSKLSYYLICLLFFLWGMSFFVWKEKSGFSIKQTVQDHWKGLLFCLLLASVIFVSCPPYFRVLSDETNLLSVSKSMATDRTIDNVTMGKWYYFNYNAFNREIPVRPFAHPFIVHFFHVLFGYQPGNAFLVNFIQLFLLLALIFCMVRRWTGGYAAYAAVILTAAQPAISQTATCGGFDFTAAFFMVLCFASLQSFLQKPSKASFGWLWWSLILLANIRQESPVFFVITMSLLLATRKLKVDYFRPFWVYCLTPLIFVNRVWQQMLILKIDQFETPDGIKPFAIAHLVEHAKHFLETFIRFDFVLPYATLINVLGLIGLLFFIFRLSQTQQNENSTTVSLSLISSLNLLGFWLVMNAYHMGDPAHAASIRYFVIFYVVLSISAAIWCHQWFIFRKQPYGLILAAILLFAIYHGQSVQNRYSNALFLPREYRAVTDYFKKLDHKNLLVITDRPGQFTVLNYGAVNFPYANEHGSELINELRRHLFRDMYVIQEIEYETEKPNKDTALSPDYLLKPVFELQNKAESYIRISKVEP